MKRIRRKRADSPARMLYADTEKSADLYYAVRLMVPDPFLFFEIGGRRYVLLSDLEYSRVKKAVQGVFVESYTEWRKRAQEKRRGEGLWDVAAFFLKAHGRRRVFVPFDFPHGAARALENRGVSISLWEGPFFPQRVFKTPWEIAAIRFVQRAVERAVHLVEKTLQQAKIEGGFLWWRGARLTSERLRRVIHQSLWEDDCFPAHTIVAGGEQAVDPHQEGFGPLRPKKAIVVDVFPRSQKTGYFADMTRTFVKGKPSERLQTLYETVREGQALGLSMVRSGVDGSRIHQAILSFFEKKGFPTKKEGQAPVGFFHGTGHGLGLEVHEPPRINPSPCILRERQVVTVEPGLYYPDLGGVRLEDLVVVRRNGCENLTTYPKRFVVP